LLNRIVCVNFCSPSNHSCIVLILPRTNHGCLVKPKHEQTSSCQFPEFSNTLARAKNYSLEFLLCLLNSKLVSWYAYRYIFSKAIRTMDLDDYYLGKIPLPRIKIDNSVFIDLANKMLSFKKRLDETGEKRTDEYAKIEDEIKKTNSEVDEQVYKIYGLTEDEKKTIEDSLK